MITVFMQIPLVLGKYGIGHSAWAHFIQRKVFFEPFVILFGKNDELESCK